MSRFYMPVASRFADATDKYQDSDKNNETAANIAMNTELSSFDFITRNKELGRYFGAYMKGVQASEGTNFRHVISGYDWESLGEGFVVHVRHHSIYTFAQAMTNPPTPPRSVAPQAASA